MHRKMYLHAFACMNYLQMHRGKANNIGCLCKGKRIIEGQNMIFLNHYHYNHFSHYNHFYNAFVFKHFNSFVAVYYIP